MCNASQGTNAHAVTSAYALNTSVDPCHLRTWHHKSHWAQQKISDPLIHCFLPQSGSSGAVYQSQINNAQLADLRCLEWQGSCIFSNSCTLQAAQASVRLSLGDGQAVVPCLVSVSFPLKSWCIQTESRSLLETRLDLHSGYLSLQAVGSQSVQKHTLLSSAVARYSIRQDPSNEDLEACKHHALIPRQETSGTGVSRLGSTALPCYPLQSSLLSSHLGEFESAMLLGLPLLETPASLMQLDAVHGNQQDLGSSNPLYVSAKPDEAASVHILRAGDSSCMTGANFKPMQRLNPAAGHALEESLLCVEWQTSVPTVHQQQSSGASLVFPRVSSPGAFTASLMASVQSALQSNGNIQADLISIAPRACSPVAFQASSPLMGCAAGILKTAASEVHGFDYDLAGLESSSTSRMRLCAAGKASSLDVSAPRIKDVRGSQLQAPKFARCCPIPGSGLQKTSLGVSIVTGGTGILGGLIAQYLARSGCRRIILLGRSGRRSSEAPQEPGVTLEMRLCHLGASEDSKDISSQVVAGAQEIGIVHAGGVLADATINNQNIGGLRRVFGPKIDGIMQFQKHLASCATTPSMLFSSIAATWGSPGQAQYAAANSALDSLAATLQSQGSGALSVNWGAWAGAGMAMRDPGTTMRMQRIGIGMVEPASGMSAFKLLMHMGAPPSAIVASPVHWSAFMQNVHARDAQCYTDMWQEADNQDSEDSITPQLAVQAPDEVYPSSAAEIRRCSAAEAESQASGLSFALCCLAHALFQGYTSGPVPTVLAGARGYPQHHRTGCRPFSATNL